MKQKDLSDTFYDAMINLLFKYIKDLIDWNRVQSFVPKNLIWYNDKKKCQLLLALADVNSAYCTKYNSNDDIASSIRESVVYMDNFRPTRSVMYMKAYRKQYLIDIFDIFAHTYDNVLKSAKYSHEDALSIIKLHEADMLMSVANSIQRDYKNIIDSSTTEEEFVDNNKFVIELCKELQTFTSLFSFNCKRATTNVISLLFDIQALYDMAFDPGNKSYQKNILDDFELIKRKKLISDIISTIMQTINDVIESAYISENKFDKENQCVMKIHRLAIPEENDDICEIKIACCDPMIITS